MAPGCFSWCPLLNRQNLSSSTHVAGVEKSSVRFSLVKLKDEITIILVKFFAIDLGIYSRSWERDLEGLEKCCKFYSSSIDPGGHSSSS